MLEIAELLREVGLSSCALKVRAMNPRVKKVIPNDDYTLRITFDNKEQKVFDIKPLLDFGVFQELKNLEYFKEVKRVHGSIAWPHGQDICPDTLYEESK